MPSVNLKIEKLEETSEAKVELKTDLINNFIEDGDFYLYYLKKFMTKSDGKKHKR